jgi:hypothetical protein
MNVSLPSNIPFNVSLINKKTYKFFFEKNQRISTNNKLNVKVTRAVHFNSLPILEKLVNVGFLLCSKLFFKHNFPIKTFFSKNLLNITNFINFFYQKPTVLILLSLRKVHVYFLLSKLI